MTSRPARAVRPRLEVEVTPIIAFAALLFHRVEIVARGSGHAPYASRRRRVPMRQCRFTIYERYASLRCHAAPEHFDRRYATPPRVFYA